MQKVSSIVSKTIGNTLTNIKTWDGVMYNVLQEGLVGGGVVDDTAALQSLINRAIAAGRRTIYFPHGENGQYYVSALTNAGQVDFVGDNCTFVGGYNGTIANFGGLAALQADTTSRAVNVLFPPIPMVPAYGGGVTDDSGAFKGILNGLSGKRVIIPPLTYKFDIPIEVTMNNVEIIAYGATIDCRGTRDIPGVNGIGGGMTITGSGNVIRGLSYLGYHADQGSTNYGFGDLLSIIGNLNKVLECNFKEGNSGALYFNGNKNLVSECNFDTCNNHGAVGAHFGAININSGYGNVVVNNWIENHYYSGVALFGDVSKTRIEGNFIKALNPLGQDTSMGVYVFNGAARDLEIINNTIENVTAEAVVVFSNGALPTNTVKIRGNILRDYDGTGVAIYMGSDSASSTNVDIEGNTFQSKTLDPGFHIYTEMLNRSSITKNKIFGRETGVGTIAEGIHVGSSPNSNIVKNNQIFNVNLGIFFADFLGGDCSENEIVKCTTGIQYQNCQRAKISGNNIIDCPTPLNKVLNAEFAFVAGNMISGQTTVPNGITVYGDMQTTTGATSPYATGTLVAGSATITFFNIDDGDAFVVIPTSYAVTANCGALYVAEQNASLDTMIIKSTNPADTRKFFVLKIARGGLS